MDGRSYEARVEEQPGRPGRGDRGRRFEIDVRDPRRWSRERRAGAWRGPAKRAAPMPGKVVRVLVAAGDQCEAGQGLVVVEAMKMQNEMKAPRDGRVVYVPAREGATVRRRRSAGDPRVRPLNVRSANDIPAKAAPTLLARRCSTARMPAVRREPWAATSGRCRTAPNRTTSGRRGSRAPAPRNRPRRRR